MQKKNLENQKTPQIDDRPAVDTKVSEKIEAKEGPSKRFKTHFNSQPEKGEILPALQPGLTVPNQSMTIREIFQRHAAGLPLTGSKIPYYEDEEMQDIIPPDWEKMDLSEKHDFVEQAVIHKQEIEKRLRAIQKTVQQEQFKREKEANRKENQQPAPSAGQENIPKSNTDGK